MSPDWAAKAEPVPYAKMDNPQSLNLYAYAGNNPVGNVDADGHLYGDPRNPLGLPPDFSVQLETYHEVIEADYLQAHGAIEVPRAQQRKDNGRLVSIGGTEKLALVPLVEHYVFGRGTDYILSDEEFSKFIVQMQKDGRLNGAQMPVPGMPDGVTQQLVDAQGTSYALSVGHTTVYYLNGKPAGYRDLWDFDAKPAGQRTPQAEMETHVGDILLNKLGQGMPFWVEYGIHPH